MKSFLAFLILLLICLCFSCEKKDPPTPIIIDGFEFYE